LLVAATVVVIGATIYVAVSPPWKPPRDVPSDTGPSIAQRTRKVLEEALNQADSLPDSGQTLRRNAYEQIATRALAHVRFQDGRDVLVRPILAQALMRMDRLKEAEQVVDDLLALAPALGEGLWLKGDILRLRGDGGYLEYYSRAAESPQGDPRVWAAYGMEMLRRGRASDAEKYLTKAEQGGQRSPLVLSGLAELAMGANDFARAEALLGEAMKEGATRSTQVLGMLAEAQKAGGKLQQAEETARKALAMRKTGPLQMLLGDVLLLRKKPGEAAEAFAAASELPGHGAPGALKAARCYYLAENYALAMKYIDVAAARHGDNPEVARWVKMIEDARFGAPAADANGAPAIRLPRPGELPPPEEPSTKPAGV
jgi:predicted Zn-dependent protease